MILKKHVLTEKVFKFSKVGEGEKYCFYVDEGANKIMIKNEVEKCFSVVVDKVNVLNNSIKFKKVFLGRKRVEKIKGGQKKAYVSLKKGYSINFENSL